MEIENLDSTFVGAESTTVEKLVRVMESYPRKRPIYTYIIFKISFQGLLRSPKTYPWPVLMDKT